jgi:carbon-monoxide dehydrogenase large subunit
MIWGVDERELGRPRRRVEDDRLIRGRGRYVDDLAPADSLHGAFLRSPFPDAAIRRISTEAALAAPGVVAVLTGRDLPDPT